MSNTNNKKEYEKVVNLTVKPKDIVTVIKTQHGNMGLVELSENSFIAIAKNWFNKDKKGVLSIGVTPEKTYSEWVKVDGEFKYSEKHIDGAEVVSTLSKRLEKYVFPEMTEQDILKALF